MLEQQRNLTEWAELLGVALNTLKNWAVNEGLPAEARGNRLLVTGTSLRAFLVSNQQLRAAPKALLRLEDACRASVAIDRPAPVDLGVADGDPAGRTVLRELRAQVATLHQELDVSRQEERRLRGERDMWRARARAHRDTLRRQLDLEQEADATTTD